MLKRLYCWLTGHDHSVTFWNARGAILTCRKCGHQRWHFINRPFQ